MVLNSATAAIACGAGQQPVHGGRPWPEGAAVTAYVVAPVARREDPYRRGQIKLARKREVGRRRMHTVRQRNRAERRIGLRGVGRVGEADEGRRGKRWGGERGADEAGGVGSNILWHMVGQRCQLQQDIQKHLPLVVWLVWLDPCGVFIPGMRY